MAEKRYSFNWERGHPNFWDNYCDLADCYLTCEDVCELLNELDSENQKLKERRHEDINELSVIAMKYKALEDTGNALSRHIGILKIRLQDKDELLRKELQINENYLDKINTLENTVKEAIKNERTELGQSVLKNLAVNLGIHDYDN